MSSNENEQLIFELEQNYEQQQDQISEETNLVSLQDDDEDMDIEQQVQKSIENADYEQNYDIEGQTFNLKNKAQAQLIQYAQNNTESLSQEMQQSDDRQEGNLQQLEDQKKVYQMNVIQDYQQVVQNLHFDFKSAENLKELQSYDVFRGEFINDKKILVTNPNDMYSHQFSDKNQIKQNKSQHNGFNHFNNLLNNRQNVSFSQEKSIRNKQLQRQLQNELQLQREYMSFKSKNTSEKQKKIISIKQLSGENVKKEDVYQIMFSTLIDQQNQINKQEMIKGKNYLKNLCFKKSSNKKLLNLIDHQINLENKENFKLDKALLQPFKPIQYFKDIQLTLDEQSIQDYVESPCFRVKQIRIRDKLTKNGQIKTLIRSSNLLQEMSNDYSCNSQIQYLKEKQFINRLVSFISYNEDLIHENMTKETASLKIRNWVNENIENDKDPKKSIQKMMKQVDYEKMKHIMKYMNFYGKQGWKKHTNKYKNLLIQDEIKDSQQVINKISSYVNGIVNEDIEEYSKLDNINLIGIPQTTVISISELNFQNIYQQNPPLKSEYEDSQNIVETQLTEITEGIERVIRHKKVQVLLQMDQFVLIDKHVLFELNDLLINKFKIEATKAVSLLLFKSNIKNKVKSNIQAQKDLQKVDQFMHYQDITWKNQHNIQQFVKLDNPNQLSEQIIINAFESFQPPLGKFINNGFCQVDWNVIKNCEQQFNQRCIDQNSSIKQQQFTYQISKFLKSFVSIRSIQPALVKMPKEYFAKSFGLNIKKDLFDIEKRNLPIRIKYKLTFLEEKMCNLVYDYMQVLRFNDLVKATSIQKCQKLQLKRIVDLHDKEGLPVKFSSYPACEFLQPNDKSNANKIIFGENSHSIFFKMYFREKRKVDMHILLTRVLQNMYEISAKDTNKKNKKIRKSFAEDLLMIKRKIETTKKTRHQSIEFGIGCRQYQNLCKLRNNIFQGVTDMNLNRIIHNKKLSRYDLQLLSPQEIDNMGNCGYQSEYQDEIDNVPYIRKYRRQNCTDHYDKKYRNFILAKNLTPLSHFVKDNFNIFYKSIVTLGGIDISQRSKNYKTLFHYGYKCQLFRDPQNPLLFFEIYVPVKIEKAQAKIREYEYFMRDKKETNELKNMKISKMQSQDSFKITRRMTTDGNPLKFEWQDGPRFNYQQKGFVNKEVSNLMNVGDFETDEDMRKMNLSEFEKSDIDESEGSVTKSVHSAKPVVQPKKKFSVLINNNEPQITKGRVTIIFNPYKHYQEQRLKKMKEEEKNKQKQEVKQIYSVINNLDIRNQQELENAVQKEKQALINRIINQTRVEVSTDNHNEIKLFNEWGRKHHKKLKKACLDYTQSQFPKKPSQFFMYDVNYLNMMNERNRRQSQSPDILSNILSNEEERLEKSVELQEQDSYKLKVKQVQQEKSSKNKRRSSSHMVLNQLSYQNLFSEQINELPFQNGSEESSHAFSSISDTTKQDIKEESIKINNENQDEELKQINVMLNQQNLDLIKKQSALEFQKQLPSFDKLYKDDTLFKNKIQNIIENTAVNSNYAKKLQSSHDHLLRKIINIDNTGKIIKFRDAHHLQDHSCDDDEDDEDHENIEGNNQNEFLLGNELDLLYKFEKKKFQKKNRQLKKKKQKEALSFLLESKNNKELNMLQSIKISEQMRRYEMPKGKLTPEQYTQYQKKLNITKTAIYIKNKVGIDFDLPQMAESINAEELTASFSQTIKSSSKFMEDVSDMMTRFLREINKKLYKAVIRQEHVAVQEIMDRYQVDYEQTDNDGNNLIIIATMLMDETLMKILIKKQEFNINHKNNDGNTALHFACAIPYKKIVNLLLSKGAHEDIINNEGKTCWQMNPAYE